MRFIWFGLAIALLVSSVSAQDKKEDAPQSSTIVLVNGHPVKGKVLEVDGKHFVAIEDLAQSLRGTIAYSDGQIALTLSRPPTTPAEPQVPQPSSATARPNARQPPPVTAPPPPVAAQPSTPQAPTVAAQPQQTGSIKGTLTYFFSFHDGNKPDTGSKVWLVKDRVEIPADQNFVGTSTAIGTSANPLQYTPVKYSVADDKGNFELLDIPPGQYTLILKSAHTKGTLKDKRSFFGRGKSNPRDSNGRIESLNLQIKAGETSDASKDFGPNVDM